MSVFRKGCEKHHETKSVRYAKSDRRRGFTLTEVLLVLAIIGVIAAMVVPNLIGTQKQAYIRRHQAEFQAPFEGRGEELCASPTAASFRPALATEVIAILTIPAGFHRPADPAALDGHPERPRQQVLYYEFPSSKVPSGTKPAIWSSGPNKQNEDGGGDDINNWSSTVSRNDECGMSER